MTGAAYLERAAQAPRAGVGDGRYSRRFISRSEFPGAKAARLAYERQCIIEAKSRRVTLRNWSLEAGAWGSDDDADFEMFPDHECPWDIVMAR